MDERILRIVRHPATVPTVIGVLSFGAGVGVGFLLGRRNKEEVVPENEQLELDFSNFEVYENIAKQYVAGLLDTEDDDETEDAPVQVSDQEYYPESTVPNVTPETFHKKDPAAFVRELVRKDVFASSGGDWDYATEVAKRNEEKPYIIHADEFHANELDYTQSSLCYYVGDDILVDNLQQVIYNHPAVVGDLKFGYGSNDPTVVFVRNDKYKAEYEVLKHDGAYQVEVLGLDWEEAEIAEDIKHSRTRKLRPE